MVAEVGSRQYNLGILLALGSCVLFAVIYFIPSTLTALTPMELFSSRILITVPLLAIFLRVSRGWHLVTASLQILRRKPWFILLLALNAAILNLQLWLFTWAPQVGRSMDVALGYFLLPLAMVVVGVVGYKERLSLLRKIAVFGAAVGIISTFFFDAAVSWPTFAVCLGYPLYFVVRRQTGLNTIGALLLELALLVPSSLYFTLRPSTLTVFQDNTNLIMGVLLFGMIATLAQTAYIYSSRLLPFNLFGLLTYAEPILLLVVSVLLLGGTIVPGEYLLYAGIGLALTCLVLESLRRK